MKKILILAFCLSLVACTGAGEYFEPRTYDVRNSVWERMSQQEREDAKRTYFEEQRLAAQREQNRIMREQLEEMRRSREDANYNAAQPRRSNRNSSHYDHHQRHLQQHHRHVTQHHQVHVPRVEVPRVEAPRVEVPRPQLSQEQRDIEEAKRRSLITKRQEDARRQRAYDQEQRDIAEATRRSMETYNAEQARRNQSQDQNHSNWQPNEGQLVRGGELVMGLQREIGRQPNASEMQNRLQSHMGLSAAQANKVLDELGLI